MKWQTEQDGGLIHINHWISSYLKRQGYTREQLLRHHYIIIDDIIIPYLEPYLTVCRYSFLPLNYANIHAISPMIYFFIFLEQKLIYHGYFRNMKTFSAGKRHIL